MRPNKTQLTAKQVARLFQVSYATVMKWARAGQIPCYKLHGSLWRFPIDELKEWCAKQRAPWRVCALANHLKEGENNAKPN